MSREIRIQEGGVSKLLTVDKLRTALDGGGSCLWVPEADVALGSRTIRSNGTFYAADDGFYGYSRVTVSGIGSVTGKSSDGSGDDATATVDPVTGQITVSKLPSSMKVVTPPENEYGIYQDGQAIETAGMVAKGYTASGEEWGTVPVGEITLSPTTAVYDAATDQGGGDGGTATIDNTTGLSDAVIAVANSGAITYGNNIIYSGQYNTGTQESGVSEGAVNIQGESDVYFFAINDTSITYKFYACSLSPFSATQQQYNQWGNYTSRVTSSSYTVNNQPVHVASFTAPYKDGTEVITPGLIEISSSNYNREIAYVILYGTRQEDRAGSVQTITASWARPGDGQVLTADFEILVAPGYGSDE